MSLSKFGTNTLTKPTQNIILIEQHDSRHGFSGSRYPGMSGWYCQSGNSNLSSPMMNFLSLLVCANSTFSEPSNDNIVVKE